jgi:hypothetical protein
MRLYGVPAEFYLYMGIYLGTAASLLVGTGLWLYYEHVKEIAKYGYVYPDQDGMPFDAMMESELKGEGLGGFENHHRPGMASIVSKTSSSVRLKSGFKVHPEVQATAEMDASEGTLSEGKNGGSLSQGRKDSRDSESSGMYQGTGDDRERLIDTSNLPQQSFSATSKGTINRLSNPMLSKIKNESNPALSKAKSTSSASLNNSGGWKRSQEQIRQEL